VNYPYTGQPLDALMAAQTSAALVLGATVWARRIRPWPAAALFLAAIALVTILPVEPDFLRGLGTTLGPDHVKHALKLAAALASVAALVTRQRRLVIVAVLGQAALWPITDYIQECDWDLAAAHLAFFGLLVGLYRQTETVPPAESSGPYELHRDFWRDDALLGAIATLAATLVCWLVLQRRTNSGDEWANTYQAALFARLHAYGAVPHCSEALRSFYVFQYMGRSFSQYTPGWPYFMAPFLLLHMAWLAGPVSFGLLAAGVARLARRGAAGFPNEQSVPSAARVRAAGRFAAGSIILSSTALINGASRYPHIFVAAMFAWALEALCVVATPPLPIRAQRQWGGVLGACLALMVATRPPDGAVLGFGLFLYFVYALSRRRIGLQAVAPTVAVATFVGGVTLVVLRLQLGVWFKTAYSIVDLIYPWAKVSWSLPKPNEFRWGIPLAAGAYCWWPCSPAVGLAGIALLRGRARRLGFVFFVATVALLSMYTLLELGRGYDFGYGPRYELALIVPMAVGTGIVLAKLWTLAARREPSARSALSTGGPIAVALVAAGLGVVRIAPLVYPHTYADVHEHNRLHDAIDHTAPHHAVIMAGPGLILTDPMDLTENLPLDLYPNQDVIIAIDRGPDESRCVQEKYRGWTFYRTIPGDPVRLIRQ
jgi:hypothetical protein